MKRINLSRHAFVDIPDKLPITLDGKINIIFQYRWHAAAVPSENVKLVQALVVYGDHPGLNSGDSGELGSVDFVNKSVKKILDEVQVPLGNLGFSAYSGGGIALYNLFKHKDDLIIHPPDAVIMSDAGYGGKAVIPVFGPLAQEYADNKFYYKKFVMLHTRSLESNFDSTTKTANALLKACGVEKSTTNIDESNKSDFWKDWSFKPDTWTQKGSLIVLDTTATHADAGKIVPQLWDSFLSDWY